MTEDEPSEDERDIELSSIQAIFPELEIFPGEPRKAQIDLEIAPASKLSIIFDQPKPLQPQTLVIPGNIDPAITEPSTSESQAPIEVVDLHELEYLPSLHLDISLTASYPDDLPPDVKLSTHMNWLPKEVLDRLLSERPSLWEEYGHSQVLFAYIDFLQQEAEQGFKMVNWSLHLPHKLKEPLLDFNQRTKRKKFEQGTYDCGICLEPKKGSSCHSLSKCGHIFCISCLQDFYNIAITEGDVASVKCLNPDCNKDKKKKQHGLHPRELLSIPLDRIQVQRYVDMRLKKMLESDKDSIYCPRSFCQAPARSVKFAKYNSADLESYPESDDELEEVHQDPPAALPANQQEPTVIGYTPPADRLSICSKCQYAFCKVCEKSWHGDLVACRAKDSQMTGEELLSYDYIRLHTSPCPTCASPCQKTHGCNHMICATCKTHFCYLCSSWLTSQNPYKHFNTKGSGCYMRLWELEEGHDPEAAARRPEADFNFVGARGAEQAAAFADVLEEEEDDIEDRQPAAAVPRVPQVARAPRAPPHNRNGPGGGVRRVDPALERFLEMAANDEEDGWDSDEWPELAYGWHVVSDDEEDD